MLQKHGHWQCEINNLVVTQKAMKRIMLGKSLINGRRNGKDTEAEV